MRVTFWGVRGSITTPEPEYSRYGGNTPCVAVLLSDGSGIILDAGMPLFDRERQAVDTNQLRSATSESLLQSGWIPPVPGLFTPGPEVDAILISHAHEDHTGLISRTHPTIPIFTSRGTSKMMLAGFLFARQPSLPRERYREIQYHVPVQIGDFEVTGIPVDHSIFGSMAFLIRGEGKTILYSGNALPFDRDRPKTIGGCPPDGRDSRREPGIQRCHRI